MAVIESKGNGYSLFNGVKLPSLPEWDKTVYPYADISNAEKDGALFYLTAYATRMIVNADRKLVTADGTDTRFVYYEYKNDSWVLCEENAVYKNKTALSITDYPPIWANYDILNDTDNSVYLAASEPISLDGMNVIEWDGNTEGLELFPNNTMFYHVSTATNIDTTKQYAAVRINTDNNSIRGVKGEFSTAEGYYSAGTVGRYIDEISDNYTTAGIFMLNNSSKLITSLFAYYPIEEPTTGDKTTISFNNKEYSIDTAALSPATSALKSHLSTVMNGTGAVINLGGTAYNVDSAKLSAITNTFVQHLGTIAGDGHKVVVGGVEYGVDAAKLQEAIVELDATWGN